MIIKWYNRDNISDVEMKQARLVADRLQGVKFDNFFIPNSYYDHLKTFEVKYERKYMLEGWEPAPQWVKDAKEDDRKREDRK